MNEKTDFVSLSRSTLAISMMAAYVLLHVAYSIAAVAILAGADVATAFHSEQSW